MNLPLTEGDLEWADSVTEKPKAELLQYLEFSLHLKIIMKKLLIYMIQFYRRYLSPMKSTKCPYIPTCSEYGLEAVSKYGAFKGGLLTVWRILRCNPFSKGGYDPVP